MALKQTKSYAMFRGKIYGLNSEKKSPVSSNDFASKLQFIVKTDEDNVHYCQVTQWLSQVGKEVYFSSTTEKGTTQKVPWDKRYENFENWKLIGVGVKGPNEQETKTFVPMDAIDAIQSKFTDGDSVFVKCTKTSSARGNNVYTNYEINAIYTTQDEVNFESEDFEEVSDFMDEVVFVSTGGTSKKMEVEAYHIGYKDALTLVTYTVDMEDDDSKEVGNYIKKNLKFGDVVKLEGIIHNRAVVEWKDKDGGEQTSVVGKKRKAFGGGSNKEKVVTGEREEFEIVAIAEVKSGVYKQSDFEQEEAEKMPWEQ